MTTKRVITLLLFTCTLFQIKAANLPKSLVPSIAGKAPDYFCTWNTQGFANACRTAAMRFAMTEENMFGKGQYQNWLSYYPDIRSDLIFVMDDSWDVPLDSTINTDSQWLGSAQLNTQRFPSYTGQATARLKKLVDHVKAKGWKGLGGWIAAQAPNNIAPENEAKYWEERLKESNDAGFSYWKVDWGKNARNSTWRKTLTTIGREHAPNVIIEHALTDQFIEFSDVYRTYDVENIIAQPSTIQRIANVLKYSAHSPAKGIINCEDEPYIAAGLGCAIGIMRHPLVGKFPNGTPDFVFPQVGRNVKSRVGKVIRGVRWHRIADPFAVGSSYEIDTVKIGDQWVLAANETWMQGSNGRRIGDTIVEKAPARVSRALSLPVIKNKGNKTTQPFVLSSRYPNGAVAIATIGRAFNREYLCEPMDIEQTLIDLYTPIGIFGKYKTLTLVFPSMINASEIRILAQDLATDKATDITRRVKIEDNKLILSGELIDKIGLQKSIPGDLSDAGMVMQIFKKSDR